MKKKNVSYIVIIVLTISQIYSLFQISSLRTNMQNIENRVIYAEDSLRRNINDIYSNVDRKLEEYTGLVTSCSYEIGAFNLQTLKVPVTFKLQPKTLTGTTEIFLEISGERIPMEKQYSEFVLTKDFEIKDEIIPTIVIEDAGVQQFEKNNNLDVYNIKDRVFSSVSPRFEGECGYSGQEPFEYRMKGYITTGSSVINSDNSYKNIKYIVTLDNQVIKTYEADFVGSGNIDIKDNFKMEKGQTLIGKVIAVDMLNCTHEYLIMNYVAGNDDQREYYENEKIVAPDGTVIYEFDESKLKW